MTDISFRTDLFRVAWRFTVPGKGVRVEPAPNGGILIGATDDAAFVVFDHSAVVDRAVLIDAPKDFMDAVARTRQLKLDPSTVRVRANRAALACDHVSTIVENGVTEVAADAWRQAIDRNAFARITAPTLTFRRDVADDINQAARALARATGMPRSEAERATYTIKGGVDGAVMVEFDAWPDAFALIANAQRTPTQWAWNPPPWLAPPVRVGEVETAA